MRGFSAHGDREKALRQREEGRTIERGSTATPREEKTQERGDRKCHAPRPTPRA